MWGRWGCGGGKVWVSVAGWGWCRIKAMLKGFSSIVWVGRILVHSSNQASQIVLISITPWGCYNKGQGPELPLLLLPPLVNMFTSIPLWEINRYLLPEVPGAIPTWQPLSPKAKFQQYYPIPFPSKRVVPATPRQDAIGPAKGLSPGGGPWKCSIITE